MIRQGSAPAARKIPLETQSVADARGTARCRISLPYKPFTTMGERKKKNQSNELKETYTDRFTIICLISAMASAGLSPLGQVWAQFMIVWQR